jgi:hypothetical protein
LHRYSARSRGCSLLYFTRNQRFGIVFQKKVIGPYLCGLVPACQEKDLQTNLGVSHDTGRASLSGIQLPVDSFILLNHWTWDDHLSDYLGGSLTFAQKKSTVKTSNASHVDAVGTMAEFLSCPADEIGRTKYDDSFVRSYAINTAGGGNHYGIAHSNYSIRKTDVDATDETIMIVEQFHSYNTIGRGNHCHADNRTKWHLSETVVGHGPYKFNYLFCDRHARTYIASETGGINGSWGMWSVNPDD